MYDPQNDTQTQKSPARRSQMTPSGGADIKWRRGLASDVELVSYFILEVR